VTNFHRMGGELDPGGFSGDLGFDVSIDFGNTWTVMNECYQTNIQVWAILDAARYPQHGIYNPFGNTDPNEAFCVFFAPTLDASNAPDGWGGYCYGRSKLGDPGDTTKNLVHTDPEAGIFQYIPEGFTVTSTGDFWAVDFNFDMTWIQYSENKWLQQLIISHGVWIDMEEDYQLSQFLIPCPTQDTVNLPPCGRAEFSPDGQFGYIAVISDNGAVEISKDRSFYPILWRTDDAGQT